MPIVSELQEVIGALQSEAEFEAAALPGRRRRRQAATAIMRRHCGADVFASPSA
jgi:hypothetical protein